jgi:hypothetical protein
VPIRHQTVIAAGAIPQYRAVMRGAVDPTTQGKTAQLPTAVSSPFFAASNNLIDAVAGDLVHVIQEGQAIGTANAAILRGQELVMDVNGRLGPAAGAPPEQVVGVAEEPAAALGDFFSYTIRVYKTA